MPRRVLPLCCAVLLLVACSPAAEKDITILHTSDLHGYLMPWDYAKQVPMDAGLVAAAAVVERERKADPDLLLLDAGDTIQGTALMYYYNVRRSEAPSPMAVVMNAMKYNAMSIGVVGLTTPGILDWEKPQYIRDLRFDDVVAAARRAVVDLRKQGATVIVALCHSGLPKTPSFGKLKPDDWMTDYRSWKDKGDPGQNFIITLAEQVSGIDAILAGHTHVMIPQTLINGVLVTQPWPWGRGVSKTVLTIGEDGGVKGRRGEFLPSSRQSLSPSILKLAEPFHRRTLDFVSSQIGSAKEVFDGGMQARVKDSALADFINTVQLQMARDAGHPAQTALASVFHDEARLPRGAIRVSDVFAVYPYENTLTVLEIKGGALRRALERTATYWRRYTASAPPEDLRKLRADGMKDYNWDMYTGLEYVIDISRPAGKRVTFLSFEGRPVARGQKMILAVNGYRAGGGGGYSMFKEGKILWESSRQIRDYMIDYIREHSPLDPDAYHTLNWHLAPLGKAADVPVFAEP